MAYQLDLTKIFADVLPRCSSLQVGTLRTFLCTTELTERPLFMLHYGFLAIKGPSGFSLSTAKP